MPAMTMNEYLAFYDFDLPLKDAFLDPEEPVVRRMLAAAAMGVGLDTAHYDASELFEAIQQVGRDRRRRVVNGSGEERVREILAAEGGDYQRRIYYMISEIDVYEAAAHLTWLVAITKARAKMFGLIQRKRAMMPRLPGEGSYGPSVGVSSLYP